VNVPEQQMALIYHAREIFQANGMAPEEVMPNFKGDLGAELANVFLALLEKNTRGWDNNLFERLKAKKIWVQHAGQQFTLLHVQQVAAEKIALFHQKSVDLAEEAPNFLEGSRPRADVNAIVTGDRSRAESPNLRRSASYNRGQAKRGRFEGRGRGDSLPSLFHRRNEQVRASTEGESRQMGSRRVGDPISTICFSRS